MPEGLALVDIGNVHFDDRPGEGVERVEDGDRGVGEGGGIDDDAGGALAGGVNEVDDLVFAVALMELDRKPELLADAAAVRLDLGERLAAVNLRLTLAEQIEIGTVQDDDDRAHGASPLNMSTCRPRPEEPETGVSKDAPVCAKQARSLLDHPARRAFGAPQDEGSWARHSAVSSTTRKRSTH